MIRHVIGVLIIVFFGKITMVIIYLDERGFQYSAFGSMD